MYNERVTCKEGYKVEDRGYSSPCWIWTGCIMSKGYGVYFVAARKSVLAHRYYYVKYKGFISKGLQIDHLCRIRCCVNPEHLEAVTPMANRRRGLEAAYPGRGYYQRGKNRRKLNGGSIIIHDRGSSA